MTPSTSLLIRCPVAAMVEIAIGENLVYRARKIRARLRLLAPSVGLVFEIAIPMRELEAAVVGCVEVEGEDSHLAVGFVGA